MLQRHTQKMHTQDRTIQCFTHGSVIEKKCCNIREDNAHTTGINQKLRGCVPSVTRNINLGIVLCTTLTNNTLTGQWRRNAFIIQKYTLTLRVHVAKKSMNKILMHTARYRETNLNYIYLSTSHPVTRPVKNMRWFSLLSNTWDDHEKFLHGISIALLSQ